MKYLLAIVIALAGCNHPFFPQEKPEPVQPELTPEKGRIEFIKRHGLCFAIYKERKAFQESEVGHSRGYGYGYGYGYFGMAHVPCDKFPSELEAGTDRGE